MGFDITIRRADKEDAQFIARVVLSAIDMIDMGEELDDKDILFVGHISSICENDCTLYSYMNASIAEVNGNPVGAIISYDGGKYREMRKLTFDLTKEKTGIDLNENPIETEDGEYYLDSMAVLPEYRGMEIGKKLILDRIEHASELGFRKSTLLVGKENKHLQEYYESIGFKPTSEMYAFDKQYIKEQYTI